ncbi:hypothetical protein ACP70R_042817 [Stipagrostis hirtigluma subsp. patula]
MQLIRADAQGDTYAKDCAYGKMRFAAAFLYDLALEQVVVNQDADVLAEDSRSAPIEQAFVEVDGSLVGKSNAHHHVSALLDLNSTPDRQTPSGESNVASEYIVDGPRKSAPEKRRHGETVRSSKQNDKASTFKKLLYAEVAATVSTPTVSRILVLIASCYAVYKDCSRSRGVPGELGWSDKFGNGCLHCNLLKQMGIEDKSAMRAIVARL